jgi:hypothetical protein
MYTVDVGPSGEEPAMQDQGRWMSRYHAYLWLLEQRIAASFAEMYLDDARAHGQCAGSGVEVSYDSGRGEYFARAA